MFSKGIAQFINIAETCKLNVFELQSCSSINKKVLHTLFMPKSCPVIENLGTNNIVLTKKGCSVLNTRKRSALLKDCKLNRLIDFTGKIINSHIKSCFLCSLGSLKATEKKCEIKSFIKYNKKFIGQSKN